MARADNAGLSVRATFNVATGPKSQVIGAKSTPMPNSLVLANKFTPTGWNMAVEYSGLSPWVMA